jgi:hypothetical protein
MKRAAVIGGGPAGLMAAERLAGAGVAVTVYDRMASVGRKFLLGGRGGLNLTHSEPLEAFLGRYGPPNEHLHAAIEAFPPERVRAWCEALGQETFVGTSGRVFPKAMKASPLLRAWLRRLQGEGVTFAMRHHFIGWQDGALAFARPDGTIVTDTADATVLALGGSSWPRLGSDGGWVAALADAGVGVAPLRPANCGFLAPWSEPFRNRRAGAPLKRIAASFAEHTVRGEAVITADGLEGRAIYGVSAPLREAITWRSRALDRPAPRYCQGGACRPHRPRAQEGVAFDLATQDGEAFPRRNRSPARGRRAQGHSARRPAVAGTGPLDQGRSGQPDRHRRDRKGNLDGGRRFVRRNRRQIHAAQAPRGLRRRGNARLGGPDRRLSPPGVVCHRVCCGRGRHRLDGTE